MSNPIITTSIRDTNQMTINLTGNNQVLVRHYSWVEATMSATAQDGAAIDLDMCLIRNGGQTAFGTTGEFKKPVSNVFVFSAADSKGRTSQVTKTPTMIEYIKLTCNAGLSRIDALGSITMTCSGDYFNGSFGAKSNTLTVVCRYRVSGGSWSSEYSMTTSISGNSYTATKSFSGLDPKKTYEIQYFAEDRLSSMGDESGNLSSVPVFHWGKDQVAFEVPVEFKAEAFFREAPEFDGGLNISGDLRLKGEDNYGNTLYFGDGGYCYIAELTDDDMTIHADTINFEVDEGLMLNGEKVALPEYGEWTPELHIDDADYSTRKGWYTKVGDVVTVGFYIKADCYPGTEDIPIIIDGLPYTPKRSASGGGICSGAVVQTVRNFQCFVAETDGTITLRGQDCDDTDDSYLGTSASALRYPEGRELTLSGTIAYMV